MDQVKNHERPVGSFASDDAALIKTGLNLIQQGLSIFNEELRLVSWNARFIEMFELPAGFVDDGLSFYDINLFLARRGEYGPGDPETLTLDRVSRAQQFEPHYFERTRPNGRRISVEGNPLAGGGWIAVYSDITEAYRQEQMLKARSDLLSDRLLQHSGKLAETNRELAAANRALEKIKVELQASEERIRTITQAMPAHIAYLDKSYTYRFSNNRFSDIMGIERDQLDGKPITEIFPPRVFTQVKPKIDRAFNGETVIAEYAMPDGKGNVQEIRSTFTPEIDDRNIVQGVFVLSLNVTEEKSATEMLLRSKRLETTAQLTSGLAHDFSNILTVILGNLPRIGQAKTNAAQRKELIASTERAAKRGTRIIDNLMTFLFRQRLMAKETNLSRILRDLARLFTASADSRISLNLQIPSKDIVAFLDEGAFQDAVLNILFNARDAIETTSGSGTITLGAGMENCESGKKKVRIVVSDDGPGFSPEALKQANQPFFTTKPQGKGSGLGLSMVQNFIDRSHGKMIISNKHGTGAEITILLPQKAPPQSAKTEENTDRPKLDGFNANGSLLLLVDDDPELRAIMREYVARMGFSVLEAASADEAVQLMRQVPDIKAVVSDIIMPGIQSGVDLARHVVDMKGRIPVLLVSGLPASDRLVDEAKQHAGFLRKPFTEDIFHKALAERMEAP